MRQGKRWANRIAFTAFISAMLAVPFLMPGPAGKPILTMDDFVPELPELATVRNSLAYQFNNLKGSLLSSVSTVLSDKSTPDPGKTISVYRWQDGEGNWHFSDSAPAGSKTVASVIEVDSSRILALPPAQTQRPSQQPATPSSQPMDTGITITGNPLDYLKQYPEMLEKAQAARDMMNARNQQQQETLNSL